MKRALITGIGGQDGSYLAELLLREGYEVHGLYRRSSVNNLSNIDHIKDRLFLHRGDVTDYGSLQRIVCDSAPNEIYHEADQDNVDWSFKTPSYTFDVTIKGVSNLLEVVRHYDAGNPETKVFIPCSAMMFGDATPPQKEDTPFNPQSPYAVGKASIYHLSRYYRQIDGMFVSTGILYNHDSVRRNGDYLLHRICKAAVLCSLGEMKEFVFPGDIDTYVNVGCAKEFVSYFHKILQLNAPDDFVIGGRYNLTIRELMSEAFRLVGENYLVFYKSGGVHRPGKIQTLSPDCSKLMYAVKSVPYERPEHILEALVKRYQQELK